MTRKTVQGTTTDGGRRVDGNKARGQLGSALAEAALAVLPELSSYQSALWSLAAKNITLSTAMGSIRAGHRQLEPV